VQGRRGRWYVKERRVFLLLMKDVCNIVTCSVRVCLLLSTTLCCDIEYVCGGGYKVCMFIVESHYEKNGDDGCDELSASSVIDEASKKERVRRMIYGKTQSRRETSVCIDVDAAVGRKVRLWWGLSA
jgi:hypothetical protein